MSAEEFINQIGPYVVAWKNQFGFGVPSAIIGQACLESAYGTSGKAKHNNFFGLKFRLNRVTCNSGVFTDTSYEQKPDGTYVPIVTQWYEFADMNTGVEGYYQFINTGHYDNAKKQTTPEGYLQALKDAGYATSKNYVSNVMSVVDKHNLRRFDGGTTMKPDSTLVDYVKWSPNYTKQRKYPIDTIIIHCMAGNLTVERCGELFANPNRGASSHYGVGTDGRIAQYVEEKYRAWTTGGDKKCNGWTGSDYDHRAITIEVANNGGGPNWPISSEALKGTIAICVDICKRNNIKELKWSNNPKLVGDATKQNMALHRWFATKSCPGPYIIALLPYIAQSVNQQLKSNGYILNGYDYSPVFNPEYYANKYPDLMSAFGLNKDALWLHFQQFGMNEFRQASAGFNPQVYKDNYSDLREAFGDDNPMYYWHYVAFGQSEGRIAT